MYIFCIPELNGCVNSSRPLAYPALAGGQALERFCHHFVTSLLWACHHEGLMAKMEGLGWPWARASILATTRPTKRP